MNPQHGALNTENIRTLIIVATSFLWIGFICSISFMEAWLKFRAPGVTFPIGLGIGKLVFNALNKVEWVFAAIVSLGIARDHIPISPGAIFGYGITLGFLVTQTVWLLPALDKRAKAIIAGNALLPSPLHWYFIVAELGKVTALFSFSIGLIKSLF